MPKFSDNTTSSHLTIDFWVQKFHQRLPFLWDTSDRNNFLQTCWTTISSEFLVSRPILLFICSAKLDTLLLLWEVACVTALQCDKIKVFCLDLMLPGIPIQNTPRLFLLLILKWCCIGTCGTDLASCLQQKQSSTAASISYAAASEGINHLTPQPSRLDTYQASQPYSAKCNLRLSICLNFDL